MVAHQSFNEVLYKNSEILFCEPLCQYVETLSLLSEVSMAGLGLALNRLWDERKNDKFMISIPQLVSDFEQYDFLGCHGLKIGNDLRNSYHILSDHPVKQRLRVARTELLAHSIVIGKSRDRTGTDLEGISEFNILNGDVLDFADQTLELLHKILRQICISRQDNTLSLQEIKAKKYKEHLAFLKKFSADVEYLT